MTHDRAIYQEHPPCIGLQNWVAYYWHYWAPQSIEVTSHPIPPEAGITVTLLPPTVDHGSTDHIPSITSGPQRVSVDVPACPGASVFGVRFWPGTGPAFLDVSPADLVDRMVPTRAVSPRLEEALAPVQIAIATAANPTFPWLAEVLDQALEPLQPPSDALDSTMLRAVFRLMKSGHTPSTAQLCEQAALSPRQFRRRFKAAVGLSVTEFRRLQRLRATLVNAVSETTTSWIELAAENGYSDQAHLCREFQRGSGRSPKVYRRAIEHIDHVFVDG